MKLENGDFLEKNSVDELRRLIPLYEQIWGKFIGHREGRMLDASGLSQSDQKKRVNFAEHFYTCAESVLCMNYIIENYSQTKSLSIDQYFIELNNFMAFNAHIGRIMDSARKMLVGYIEDTSAHDLVEKMRNVLKRRNVVLHGKKVPIKLKDGYLHIIVPKGLKKLKDDWSDSMSWKDATGKKFLPISSFYMNVFKELLEYYNQILEPVDQSIDKLISQNNFQFRHQENNVKPEINGPQGPLISSFDPPREKSNR